MQPLRIFTILFFLLTVAGLSQERGTISGTVTDATAAAVPGAAVEVRNHATGLTQKTTTSASGQYSLPYLPAGIYSVTVESAGMKTAVARDVQVEVSTNRRVDVKLQVGQIEQSVDVIAEAPLLETTQGTNLGRTLSNQTISDLPLTIGGGLRSLTAFTLTTPGVLGDANDPIIGGGLGRSVSMRLDGAETQSSRRIGENYNPVSVDAIQEFKVMAGTYSAEYGRTSDGIVNFVTKSGTNEFRGTAYAFNRNEVFNARGYFFGAGKRSVQRQWNPGLTVGGPIVVPRVFDGRNKAFFFLSYEKSYYKTPRPSNLVTVPIEEFRRGDMRKYVDSNGVMIPIYDPFDAGGTFVSDATKRKQIQCNGMLNVICQDRLDSTYQRIISLMALPDDPTKVYNNTRAEGGGVTQGSIPSIKIDYAFSQKNRINGVFGNNYKPPNYIPNAIPGVPSEQWPTADAQNFLRVNHDYVLRSNLLNHLLVGYNWRVLTEGPGNSARIPADWAAATLLKGTTVPLIEGKSSRYTTEYATFGMDVYTKSIDSTLDIAEQLAWIKNKHSLKFGFEYINVDYRRINSNYTEGRAGFSAAATANPGVKGTTGSAWASGLLGLASSATMGYGGDSDFIIPTYTWFVQDDIRLTNKLTLNIGLRYEIPRAKTEANRNTSSLVMDLPNPGAGGILGAMEFTGNGPGRNGKDRFQQTRYNGFGPRLGIAYHILPRTVLRAGGAIFYQPQREDANGDVGVQGFGGNFTAPEDYLVQGVSFLLKDGLLTHAKLVQANKPPTIDPALQLYGTPFYFFPPGGRVPYFTDWQFTIERSFSSNTMLRLSHHGNRGIRLISSSGTDYNQLNPMYLQTYGNLLGSPISANAVIATGFKPPYQGYPTTRTLSQALRPFPQYGGINTNGGAMNDGHSTYNSFEASFEYRLSRGLFLSSAYTFSKLIASAYYERGQSVGTMNHYNRRLDKAVGQADRPQVFTLAYIYELPFGRQKYFLRSSSRPVHALVGGWSISGFHRYTSGPALAITSNQQLYGAGRARGSFAPGAGDTIPLLNPKWSPDPTVAWSVPYLNPAAFFRPNTGEYGNTPALISQLRGRGVVSEDIVLLKRVFLHERRHLELRASAFNALNRHQLPNPNTAVNSAQFGMITSPQGNAPREIQLGARLVF